jgi:SAM-dependent methyltransferase
MESLELNKCARVNKLDLQGEDAAVQSSTIRSEARAADPTARSLADLPRCRFCEAVLRHSLVDLGMSPLANSYLRPEQLDQGEAFYPLHARVCEKCFLVQLERYDLPENIFSDYAYFSSYSETWLDHARKYAESASRRFRLGPNSRVVEIASNDGYLLQYFQARSIPVLGIEPARNVAEAAQQKGIPTISRFFGLAAARELHASAQQADLVVANNVLAHVPELNDFVRGLKQLLKPSGIVTVEFPHLLRLLQENQFDTIYHEHFSYFSFCAAEEIFRSHGLTVFDVEELPTHGGSLRLYASHPGNSSHPVHPSVRQLRERETAAGIRDLQTYSSFGESVQETKRALLDLLIHLKREHKSIVAYGAPAKGNTLLNYCGIGKDFLDYTVDVSPHKQDHFLPGTHIPIYSPEKIRITRPDYILILPWNLRTEITAQLADVRGFGCRFIIPIPTAEVL